MFTMFLILSLLIVSSHHASAQTNPAFVSNDAYITGLHTDLDLEDPHAVFGHVFEQLPPRVTVFPSEGYYYFRFPMRGVTVKGTIVLFVNDRDRGIVSFGYTGEIESRPSRETHVSMPGRSFDFGPEDGLLLEEVDDWTYTVTYDQKLVTFSLFDPGLVAPLPSKLASDERYVGTSLDESGIRFNLLFNETLQRLYWMLDERMFVPEALTIANDDVVVGARTRFAFYLDREHDRKLLVAVRAEEVEYNSWYDGPFDQLPDTYVRMGKIDLKPLLVAHSGLRDDSMDKYGHLLAEPGARIPVASYRFYRSEDELDFVTDAKASTDGRSDFYSVIFRQDGRDEIGLRIGLLPSTD